MGYLIAEGTEKVDAVSWEVVTFIAAALASAIGILWKQLMDYQKKTKEDLAKCEEEKGQIRDTVTDIKLKLGRLETKLEYEQRLSDLATKAANQGSDAMTPKPKED